MEFRTFVKVYLPSSPTASSSSRDHEAIVLDPAKTPRADRRGSMTFRGTAELRNLLIAVAKKAGKTQGALVGGAADHQGYACPQGRRQHAPERVSFTREVLDELLE